MSSGITRRDLLTSALAVGASFAVAPGHASPAPLLGHEIVGSGPEVVVVLHEWLGDHTNYDGVRPYLNKSAFTYVFADLRGYGWSKSQSGAYTVEEAAADVLALMNALGHGRFHVVGHSMSGMVAQYLMAIATDRLSSVVCVSPVLAFGFKTDEAGLAKLRAAITDDNAARQAIASRTGGRYSAAWLARKLTIARQAAKPAMEGYLRMFTGTDFASRMPGLATPVALITGAQDVPFYQRGNVEPVMRKWFTNFHATEIQDAGHYSMLETPILFASLMEQGLTGKPLPQEQWRSGKSGPSAS